jgi:cytidyltransferase-like protein
VSRNVFADGAWDLLHYNHIEFLREAAKLGDRLVVGVVTDEWVSSYKRRPILTEDERLRTIVAMGFVDHAFLLDGPFTAERMIMLIERYDLSAVVYGSPGFDDFYRPAMERGIFRRLDYRPGINTTQIIERVRRAYASVRGDPERADPA